jgi:hypothetical protein
LRAFLIGIMSWGITHQIFSPPALNMSWIP